MHSVFKHPHQEFKELSLYRGFFNTGIRVSFTKMLTGCQATADKLVGLQSKLRLKLFLILRGKQSTHNLRAH